ncbi:MAG: hypothetical protein Q8R60_02015 [Mycobacteriales bacterium]|nr:hypothetical protein [Mycobacteriales bacterium]
MPQLTTDVRSAIRFFAFFVGNGTLGIADVFKDFEGDYRDSLLGYGSDLERLFAIFTNVLDVREDGTVTNEHAAGQRAAQWWRARLDPTYVVEPPFEDWECELV